MWVWSSKRYYKGNDSDQTDKQSSSFPLFSFDSSPEAQAAIQRNSTDLSDNVDAGDDDDEEQQMWCGRLIILMAMSNGVRIEF